MATFTMALHEVLGVDRPRDANPTLIGLDEYPIWDNGYRDTLNEKIIKRFWNREIGFETPSMFRFNMDRLMGEIMPYYNELARTTVMDFDPFETLHMVTEGEAESTGRNTTDSQSQSTEESESSQRNTSENRSRNVNSEHPQTRLNEFEDYATASSEAVSESDGDSEGASSGSGSQSVTGEASTEGEQRNRNVQRGTQGSKAALLQQYRDTIIGVDTLILEELEVLFMGVWDTDQSYTRIESPYPYHRLLF